MNHLFLTLAFLQALAGSPALADPGICALVAELNGFIAERTQYVPDQDCPKIGFSALPAAGEWRSQVGAFDPATGAIELAPDLDLTTTYGQSYLLHELHHAAQFIAGADLRVDCPAQLEGEAYRLQSEFLREHGLPREAIMVRIMADQLGTCGELAEY
jgi:hypothetical protein